MWPHGRNTAHKFSSHCNYYHLMADLTKGRELAELTTLKRPHTNALYGRDEMRILNKHKVEYLEQTTPQLRADVFRSKILVDIFNYWIDEGTLPRETNFIDKARVGTILYYCCIRLLATWPFVKKLAGWIRNNWWLKSTT